MAKRSPTLIVLSAALIVVGGARSFAGFADIRRTADPAASSSARSIPTATTKPAPSVPVLVPMAEVEAEKGKTGVAGYTEMAAIYAGLSAPRAATLVAGLPTDDAARLLRAMPSKAAGAILTELDDQTAILLTLAMAQEVPD